MEPAGYAVLTWADAGVYHCCVGGSVFSFGTRNELCGYLEARERSLAASERERALAKAKWDAALRRDMEAQRATHEARTLRQAAQRTAASKLDERGRSALAILMRKGLL